MELSTESREPEPNIGSQLLQFICAANWIRTCIPDFNRVMAPLAELLERIFSVAGKRTKKAAAHVNLDVLKDDASSFVRLEPTTDADAQSVVEVLMKLFASLGQ